MSAAAPLLAVNGLGVRFGRHAVLEDVDLVVRRGEFVVVVGPNGAGKTTLLRAAAGLLPFKGSVRLNEEPLARISVKDRARRVAYLPQGHVFHWPLAVTDIVGLGRLPRTGGADLSTTDVDAVRRAMAETGVVEHANRAVTTLSGGERARVALARVLASEADLVLADEPTASLDPRYQLVILDILQRYARRGGAVVAVLHDLGLAARRADRIVVLSGGRLVADGKPGEVLTKERLAETFGVRAQIVSLVDGKVVIPWQVM